MKELDTRWMDKALCKGYPYPDDFFPERGVNTISTKVKLLCESCPVKEPCLEYALATHQKGIWGGTTVRDRIRIRSERIKERYNVEPTVRRDQTGS